MKLRTDVIKMYKDIHGWMGIVSGLALFIAYYAGAVTMFENQIQRWAFPPSMMAPAPSLDDTAALISKVVETHPEAAKKFAVNLVIDSANPASVLAGRYSAVRRDQRLELPRVAALATILIPVASLYAGTVWYDSAGLLLVDVTAIMMCGILLAISRAASQRAGDGPTDSVWSQNNGTPLAERSY